MIALEACDSSGNITKLQTKGDYHALLQTAFSADAGATWNSFSIGSYVHENNKVLYDEIRFFGDEYTGEPILRFMNHTNSMVWDLHITDEGVTLLKSTDSGMYFDKQWSINI